MSETIFRIQKNADNPFVMIDKRIFTDKKLSYRAKGVLGYLLSRPDNWLVNMVDVANQSTEGRDAVITAVNELMKHGYVERIEHRENGRFKSYEYLVYEVPKSVVPSDDTAHWKSVNGKSVNGLSVNGLSVSGKSATTNKDITKKEYKESDAPAQNSEIDLSTEKPTAIETFEFLKQSLVFGSEFGVISEREPNLSEINALVTEVDCFWSNKHLTKKQLLGKILSSVGRLSISDRLGKYTVTQSNPTDAPAVENWDGRQGEQISDFVAPLPMKGVVRD
jgi:hypothetical protein